MKTTTTDLTIRRLTGDDRAALVRLAQRDAAVPPGGTLLGVASASGELLAAISLETGELVADPFVASEHAARLLRLRAAQVSDQADFAVNGHRSGLLAAGLRRLVTARLGAVSRRGRRSRPAAPVRAGLSAARAAPSSARRS